MPVEPITKHRNIFFFHENFTLYQNPIYFKSQSRPLSRVVGDYFWGKFAALTSRPAASEEAALHAYANHVAPAPPVEAPAPVVAEREDPVAVAVIARLTAQLAEAYGALVAFGPRCDTCGLPATSAAPGQFGDPW